MPTRELARSMHNVGTGDGIAVPMIEHYSRKMYQFMWKNFSPEDVADHFQRLSRSDQEAILEFLSSP